MLTAMGVVMPEPQAPKAGGFQSAGLTTSTAPLRCIVLLVLILTGCTSKVPTHPVALALAHPTPTTAPAAAASPAQLFPTPIIELRGSGAEIGKQHGQKLS